MEILRSFIKKTRIHSLKRCAYKLEEAAMGILRSDKNGGNICREFFARSRRRRETQPTAIVIMLENRCK